MARGVVFSFRHDDVARGMMVRNSGLTRVREPNGFVDAAEFERIESHCDPGIKGSTENQMNDTSVAVLLVGSLDCTGRWVKYEINLSEHRRRRLLGVDNFKIRYLQDRTSMCCGQLPAGYPFSRRDNDGHPDLGTSSEEPAKAAGR